MSFCDTKQQYDTFDFGNYTIDVLDKTVEVSMKKLNDVDFLNLLSPKDLNHI
jgi:hypothetical protein